MRVMSCLLVALSNVRSHPQPQPPPQPPPQLAAAAYVIVSTPVGISAGSSSAVA